LILKLPQHYSLQKQEARHRCRKLVEKEPRSHEKHERRQETEDAEGQEIYQLVQF
jgi:hypothetical protein